MSTYPRICFLNPLVIGREQIQLPHNEHVLIEGIEMFPDEDEMSELTFLAVANVDSGFVMIQVTGTQSCRHEGRVLTRGAKYAFGPTNIIQMNGDRWEYQYEVCFNPQMPDYVLQRNLPLLVEKSEFEPQHLVTCTPSGWQECDGNQLWVYTSNQSYNSAGIAAFSLEDVLVRADSDKKRCGAILPVRYDSVEKRLNKLYNKKYKIAVFVNYPPDLPKQGGAKQTFREYVEAVVSRLAVPIQVFVAIGETKYKKPAPFMWHSMVENYNDNIVIELDRCFYVGTSADMTDRLFATNLNIHFFASGEYFKFQVPPAPLEPSFDPREAKAEKILLLTVSAVQEVVVVVGRPCSGRTFFFKNYLQDYHYSYVVGGTASAVAKLDNLLKTTKRSVFVDGTNATKEIRKEYIAVANLHRVPCRCFLMSVSRAHARHLNKFRELCSKSVKNLDELLDNYDLLYETPKSSEGFSGVIVVPFVPRFQDEELKKLYHYFLLAN